MTVFGQRFNRCPKAELRDTLTPEIRDHLGDWQRFKAHGVLPLAGGFLDQTPRFLETMSAVEAELVVCRRLEEIAKANGLRG